MRSFVCAAAAAVNSATQQIVTPATMPRRAMRFAQRDRFRVSALFMASMTARKKYGSKSMADHSPRSGVVRPHVDTGAASARATSLSCACVSFWRRSSGTRFVDGGAHRGDGVAIDAFVRVACKPRAHVRFTFANLLFQPLDERRMIGPLQLLFSGQHLSERDHGIRCAGLDGPHPPARTRDARSTRRRRRDRRGPRKNELSNTVLNCAAETGSRSLHRLTPDSNSARR